MNTHTRQTTLEPLERRSYFAAPPPWVINATSGSDAIAIRHSSSIAQVYINEGTPNSQYFRYDYPPSNMRIVVNGLGGNDTIKLGDIDFGGSVEMNGGDGDDHFVVGYFGRYAQDVDGPVTVVGGAGKDDLTIDDSKDAITSIDDIYTVTNTYIGWGGVNSGGATFEQWEVNYNSSLESAKLLGPNDKVRYNVRGTSSSTPVQINAGTKDDYFSVGNGDVDTNIRGNLSLLGNAGNDTLFVNDATDSGADAYTLELTRMTKPLSAAINFYQMEKTQLDGNLEPNVFHVLGVNNPTTIRGSNGDDLFNVGKGRITDIRQQLTLDGQTGNDVVTINDANALQNATYDVSPAQVIKNGTTPAVIKMQSIWSVDLRTGTGDDVVRVTPGLSTKFNVVANSQFSSSPGDKLELITLSNPFLTRSGSKTTYFFATGQPITTEGFETAPAEGWSIAGRVYQDTNGDGHRDGSDPYLANRTVYIDLNNNGVLDQVEPRTMTNDEGRYYLYGRTPGTYKVRQVLPTGWAQTSPSAGASRNVTVDGDDDKTGINFGSMPLL